MCVKRIVSAGYFQQVKTMIQECSLDQSCLLNDMALIRFIQKLPSKSHGFDTFYSKAISVCAGGLQIVLTVVKLIFFINVASRWMALSHSRAASGFSLTFGKCLLWLKTDWINHSSLMFVPWASHWPSLNLSFSSCKMETKILRGILAKVVWVDKWQLLNEDEIS